MAIIFVFTIIMAMVDSSEWPGSFFWVTMITVVVLNSKWIAIMPSKDAVWFSIYCMIN